MQSMAEVTYDFICSVDEKQLKKTLLTFLSSSFRQNSLLNTWVRRRHHGTRNETNKQTNNKHGEEEEIDDTACRAMSRIITQI